MLAHTESPHSGGEGYELIGGGGLPLPGYVTDLAPPGADETQSVTLYAFTASGAEVVGSGAATPEPATLAFLAVGGLLALARKRRRR